MFLIRDKLSPRRSPCKISVSILLFLLKATFSFVRDETIIFSLGESINPGLKSYTFLLILSYYYRLSFYLQLNLRNWGVPGERFARSPTRLPRPLSATPSGRPLAGDKVFAFGKLVGIAEPLFEIISFQTF